MAAFPALAHDTHMFAEKMARMPVVGPGPDADMVCDAYLEVPLFPSSLWPSGTARLGSSCVDKTPFSVCGQGFMLLHQSDVGRRGARAGLRGGPHTGNGHHGGPGFHHRTYFLFSHLFCTALVPDGLKLTWMIQHRISAASSGKSCPPSL